ncbi:hypothetical protein ACPR111641_00030 [Acinetobacter pragensis]
MPACPVKFSYLEPLYVLAAMSWALAFILIFTVDLSMSFNSLLHS